MQIFSFVLALVLLLVYSIVRANGCSFFLANVCADDEENAASRQDSVAMKNTEAK